MKTTACKLLAASALALVGVGSAYAGTIDLRNLPGNFNQSSWNGGGTRFYAQSFIADANVLEELRFIIGSGGVGNQYNIEITGARVDGGGGLGFAPDFNSIFFQTGPLATVLGETVLNPNAVVGNGTRIFVVLDGLSPAGSNNTIQATQFNGPVDQYLPGEFVFSNAAYGPAPSNALSWDHRSPNREDLAMLVRFGGGANNVPEPAPLALMGLGVLGLLMRRRAQS